MLGKPFELSNCIAAPQGDTTKIGAAIRVVFIRVERTDNVPEAMKDK